MAKAEIPDGFLPYYWPPGHILLPSPIVTAFAQKVEAEHVATQEQSCAGSENTQDGRDCDTPAEEPRAQSPDIPGRSHLVYVEPELKKLEQRMRHTKDSDARMQIQRIVIALETQGFTRDVASPQKLASLRALADLHPHFSEAVHLVHGEYVLAQRAGRPPQVPPMLLVGPPGLGKSHFARDLANVLEAPTRTLSYDTGTENSALLGLDKQWANATTGVLFELICLGSIANPVVLLEEIDKVHRFRDQDPLAALHSALEPSTAKAVTDISLDFRFDASLVTYVATANSITTIPQTLLSRFRVVEVRPPSARQAIGITEQVLLLAWRLRCPRHFEAPDRQIVLALAHLTPREARQAFEDAAATAIASGRTRVDLRDIRGVPGEPGADAPTWLH